MTFCGAGDQCLQSAAKEYQDAFLRKLNAYHIFIQLGLISQGLIQILLISCYQSIWVNFGTWLRTIKPNTLPSEKVVSMALSRLYLEFLLDRTKHTIFKKFLRHRINIGQLQHSIDEEKQVA